jgi:hypothetical protein
VHSLPFLLLDNHLIHMNRHFEENYLAGSHFCLHTFPSPGALVEFINANDPVEAVPQSASRACYIFRLTDGRMAGTCGISKRNAIPQEDITREVREGFTLEVGWIDELPTTNEFCIVAEETPHGLAIITAFPGSHARPFAQRSQPKEEYNLNRQFWKEHVLLKKK